MRLFREVKESDDPKYTVISEGEHYDKQWVCDVEPIEVTEGDIEKIMEESLPPWRNEFHKDAFRQGCKAILSKLKGE